MHMPVTWVLVADGQRARVYKVNGRGKDYVPALDREFIGNPMATRDLGTDRPGRVHDRLGPGRHSMENPTDPQRHEKRRFAREVIEAVEGERQKGAFERLVIVAPPQTLGDLRAELPSGLKALVVAEVNKDLTHLNHHELPGHLEDMMPSQL